MKRMFGLRRGGVEHQFLTAKGLTIQEADNELARLDQEVAPDGPPTIRTPRLTTDWVSVLFFLTAVFLAQNADGTTKVVLQGTPLFQVLATPDTVFLSAVPASEKSALRCLVTHADTASTYTWASRNDVVLYPFTTGGAYVNLVGVSGVVRVADIEAMSGILKAALPLIKDENLELAAYHFWDEAFLTSEAMRQQPYAYVEILWKGVGVVIYFGVADEFDP